MNISNNKWFSFFLFENSRAYIIGLILCLIMSAVLGSLTPMMISDLSRNYADSAAYYQSVWDLGILFVAVYFNRVVYQLCINKYIQMLMQDIRTKCYDKWVHSYEIKSGDKYSEDIYTQGEVISRIMNDTESLRELMTSGTFGIFINIFFVISCLISFVRLNTVSGVFLGVIEVAATILLIWGSKYMRDIFLKVRESRASMSRLLSNMVGGIKETFYTNHENYASKRGQIVFDDFLNKQLVANVWDAGYYSIAESLYPILLIFVVVIFPYSQITEAAIIFAVVDLIQRSIGPIKEIAAKIANIQRAYSGLSRINQFLDDLSLRLSSENQILAKKLTLKSISIDIEKFEYPKSNNQEDETTFSLDNISINALPGQLIGIVGLSGCGKSTLLNIMAANIYPTKGDITLKGEEESITFSRDSVESIISYREKVGIVSQESHIFSDTVGFNISMSHRKSDELTKFWNSVTSDIPYLRDWGIGLDDHFDQRNLSLGQKQLMAAIRSCYLNKPVVLFDEISSGLDGDLELALRNMVLLIQKKSLTFIVAHRVETIINADQIVVMSEGKVEAIGQHEQLIDSSKVYQEFIAELSSDLS
jgi:ATP-binding cassette subfamily B protein